MHDLNYIPPTSDRISASSVQAGHLEFVAPIKLKRSVIDWMRDILAIVFYVAGTVASVMLIIALVRVFQMYSELAAW